MVNPEFDIRRPILVGDTADVYLQRTLHILRSEGINPVVTMEFAPARDGLFCGIAEIRALLTRILPETGSEVWALEEGASVESKEVALRVKAPYGALGLYETAIAGTLSSSTGWATAAKAPIPMPMMSSRSNTFTSMSPASPILLASSAKRVGVATLPG